MNTYTLPKHPSDVNWKVIIKQRTNAITKAPVAIATCSGKSVTTGKIYGELEDVAVDYDSTTEVYSIASAIFNASNYYGFPVQVIDCAKDQQPDGVTATSNANGVSASPNMINGIAAGVRDHVYDGFFFLLVATSNFSQYSLDKNDVLNSLMDLAYQSQTFYLFHQDSSIADLDKLYAHANSLPADESKFNNSALFFDNTGHYPAANVAGFIGASVAGTSPLVGSPVAVEHIANEPEFVPITNITRTDSDHLDSINVNYAVNKADDNMIEGGKGSAGDWVDHFVNFKKIFDAYTYTAQKYLNDHNWPVFDEFHKNELHQNLVNTDAQLFKQNFLQNVSPMEFMPISKVMAEDINKRIYRNIKINPTLADPFDKVSGTITVTV